MQLANKASPNNLSGLFVGGASFFSTYSTDGTATLETDSLEFNAPKFRGYLTPSSRKRRRHEDSPKVPMSGDLAGTLSPYWFPCVTWLRAQRCVSAILLEFMFPISLPLSSSESLSPLLPCAYTPVQCALGMDDEHSTCHFHVIQLPGNLMIPTSSSPPCIDLCTPMPLWQVLSELPVGGATVAFLTFFSIGILAKR